MPKKTLGFCAVLCAAPVMAATTCDPGYYLENGTCHDCGEGYYCTGGTEPRADCMTTLPADAPIPDKIRTIHNGTWDSDTTHAIRPGDCVCDWYFYDDTRMYFKQARCELGLSGHEYTKYNWCFTGYYATNPLGWNDWYTACAPCTNAPAHSHYTSYSTPSEMYAVESNCPWECDAGYQQVDGECLQLCTIGITQIRAGDASAPLFTTRHTTPSLVVQTAGGVCYGNLTPGQGAGINIRLAGTMYRLE